MNFFNQLKNSTNLTNNEKEIVSLILNNPDEFLNMSSHSICKKCFVSTTTLYRLCQKLNLSGISELKVKISGAINNYKIENREFNFDFPVNKNEPPKHILSNMKEDYEQTILATFNLFNLKDLQSSIDAMINAKQIDIFTSAGNIFFAENFKFQMQEIGITINVPIEEYNQRLTAACSDKSHMAILISFGGRGLLISKLAETLKKNNTPILLISSTENNNIVDFCDYNLYLSSKENHYNKISSFSTRLSLLYILDVIYASYFQRNYDENLKKKLLYYRKLCE